MAWLSDWDKRIKLTLNHAVVDSDLSDFPVLVSLSTSTGIGDVDASPVFDEVGANWAKIAIASDAATPVECYIEKVSWDDTGETAELWVKFPSVLSGSDSEYYLYYDNDHADNTTYVKAQGDATSVWDSNYEMVAHMNDLTTSSVEDSTDNSNDWTKKGANEPNEVTTKIGKGQDADGNDDCLYRANRITDAQQGTVSAGVSADSITLNDTHAVFAYGGGNDGLFNFRLMGDGSHCRLEIWQRTGGGGSLYAYKTPSIINSGTDYRVALASNGTAWKIYLNGVLQSLTLVSGSNTGNWIGDTTVTETDETLVGANKYNASRGQYFNGKIDEVRLSDIERDAAYLKAEYNSGNDSLITFGSEEEAAGGWTNIFNGITSPDALGLANADIDKVIGI